MEQAGTRVDGQGDLGRRRGAWSCCAVYVHLGVDDDDDGKGAICSLFPIPFSLLQAGYWKYIFRVIPRSNVGIVVLHIKVQKMLLNLVKQVIAVKQEQEQISSIHQPTIFLLVCRALIIRNTTQYTTMGRNICDMAQAAE